MSDKHKPIKILQVKPLENKQKLPREIPDYLPQLQGEVILITSKIKSGKSNFCMNYLMNPQLMKDMFDTIYIISNTIYQDDTSRFLLEQDNVIVHDRYDDYIIDDIIETQKQYDKKDMPRICLIFDDCLGSMKMNCKGFQLASRARHYNICNLIYIVQKFSYVPRIARCNITHMITMAGIFNEKELISIDEEYDINFYNLYKKYVQKNRYNFLYCNLLTQKAYHNFDKVIHSNYDKKEPEKLEENVTENEEEKTEV